MIKYTICYELKGHIYHTEIQTSTSGAALDWIKNTIPAATNARIL